DRRFVDLNMQLRPRRIRFIDQGSGLPFVQRNRKALGPPFFAHLVGGNEFVPMPASESPASLTIEPESLELLTVEPLDCDLHKGLADQKKRPPALADDGFTVP